MALLVSWKNSLNVLKPNNAYLLFLVSIKAAFDGLRLIFPLIVGWIIGGLLVFLFKNFVFFGYVSRDAWAKVPFLYISQCNYHIFLFLILVSFAIHPSAKRKTISSVLSFDFLKVYFVSLGFFVLFELFVWFFCSYVFSGFYDSSVLLESDFVNQLLIVYFFMPILFFSLLDAGAGNNHLFKRTVLALKRTAKVVFYNAPLWIVLGIFAYLIKLVIFASQCFLLNSISEAVSVLFGIGMYIVCIPVLIAIINTIYIKRVYDEKELYV